MGMFHFSVEYYGVATRTDSLQGGSAEFQATPEGVCSIMQCDRAVSNHVFRNKR